MDSGPSEALRDSGPVPDRYTPARTHLLRVDPVLGRLIDEHPDFDPCRWVEQLPKLHAFEGILFRGVGQQQSVSSNRAIHGRLEALFGGCLREPEEFLDTYPAALRGTGISRRKVEMLRTPAERFLVDGQGEESFLNGSDEGIEARLTGIPGWAPGPSAVAS
jgi:3-methyladenine DNA glycosylase/8-oxoguanine DNA glycosylase